MHLLAACPTLAPTAYLHCHNLVAAVIHWYLMRFYSFQSCSRSRYGHKPPQCLNLPLPRYYGISDWLQILTIQVVMIFTSKRYSLLTFLARQTLMSLLKRIKRLINIAPWQQISIRCITCQFTQLPLSQLFWDVRVWSPLVAYSFKGKSQGSHWNCSATYRKLCWLVLHKY